MAIDNRVSIRIGIPCLTRIDRYCEDQRDSIESRSEFMGLCAAKQANRILGNKAPSYVKLTEANTTDVPTTTITISLNKRRQELIEQACLSTKHKLSLFIVWATMAELDAIENRKAVA